MLNSIIDFNPLLKLNICSTKSYWNGNIYHNPCVKLIINCTVIHCGNFGADFGWWSLVSLFNIFSSKLSKFPFSKLSKFSFLNCQNFLFQTIKNFHFKLSKFSYSKLSKFPFSNCQNFLFQTVKIFLFQTVKIFRSKAVKDFLFQSVKNLHQTV